MMMELKMWHSETEFVIAATSERASELAIEACKMRGEELDLEDCASEAMIEMEPDSKFTFYSDDGYEYTHRVSDWIKEKGEGWLATTEY